MENGTYLVHPSTSSYLPSGEQTWTAGPRPPKDVECVAGISSSSFLAFSSKEIHQYDSSIAGPTSADGWVVDAGWPELMERHGPGCAVLGSLCVVAGGQDALDEVLKSVEIISLETKSLIPSTNDMLKPRHHFKLILHTELTTQSLLKILYIEI